MNKILCRIAFTATVLTLGVASRPGVAAENAAKVAPQPNRLTAAVRARTSAAARGVGTRVRALVRGTLIDGPKHTLHAIRHKPKLFLGSVLAVGTLGVISNHTGIPTELAVMAGSAGALGLQIRRSMGALKAATGLERWRLIGAELVWPTALWGGTTAGGLALGHGASMGNAQAAAQSILLGGDGPAILVMAFDPAKAHASTEKPRGSRHPARRRLGRESWQGWTACVRRFSRTRLARA
jgi:hypothetical protein